MLQNLTDLITELDTEIKSQILQHHQILLLQTESNFFKSTKIFITTSLFILKLDFKKSSLFLAALHKESKEAKHSSIEDNFKEVS